MSRSNGYPEAEVIMNYADGFSYSKHKMEEAFRPGGFLEKGPAKLVKDAPTVTLKKDDIDTLVTEFEITKAHAEKILQEHGGDLSKALHALVFPATV